MMLGSDSAPTAPASPRSRRGPAPRAEGVLFAMASPLETQSTFRWPSWLAPIGTSWEKPNSSNNNYPPTRRSL
jgi:hypothetical protein